MGTSITLHLKLLLLFPVLMIVSNNPWKLPWICLSHLRCQILLTFPLCAWHVSVLINMGQKGLQIWKWILMACNAIEFTRLLFVETLFDGTETHVGIFISFIQTIDYWLMFLITHVALWVQHILQQHLKERLYPSPQMPYWSCFWLLQISFICNWVSQCYWDWLLTHCG